MRGRGIHSVKRDTAYSVALWSRKMDTRNGVTRLWLSSGDIFCLLFDIYTPLAYSIGIQKIFLLPMVIIETSVFTRQVQKLLNDEEYQELQLALAEGPDLGVIIGGSGGLRKVRWSRQGRGKRGGVRVIYYQWVQN